MTRYLLFVTALAFSLTARTSAEADEPPALRYYYPVPSANPPEKIQADVCVYGATPAGVTAAIQATRMGKTAVLVEFGRHVGGMTSSGLSATDGGKTAAGISSEFYAVVGSKGFRPAAAEAQFRAMLKQAGVRLFTEHPLASVVKDGATIKQIAMENGNVFEAKMFIDATYEGDLLAMAKVTYVVGRESNAQYGETLMASISRPAGISSNSTLIRTSFPVIPRRAFFPESPMPPPTPPARRARRTIEFRLTTSACIWPASPTPFPSPSPSITTPPGTSFSCATFRLAQARRPSRFHAAQRRRFKQQRSLLHRRHRNELRMAASQLR